MDGYKGLAEGLRPGLWASRAMEDRMAWAVTPVCVSPVGSGGLQGSMDFGFSFPLHTGHVDLGLLPNLGLVSFVWGPDNQGRGPDCAIWGQTSVVGACSGLEREFEPRAKQTESLGRTALTSCLRLKEKPQ